MGIHTEIQQALQAAHQGDRKKAQNILKAILKKDNQNEAAWLALSTIADTKRLEKTCLLHVIRINPENVTARKKLSALQMEATQEIDFSTPNGSQKHTTLNLSLASWIMVSLIIIIVAGFAGGQLMYRSYSKTVTQQFTPDLAEMGPIRTQTRSTGQTGVPPTTSSSTPIVTQTQIPSQTATTTSGPTNSPTITSSSTITNTPVPTMTPTPTHPPNALIEDIKGSPQALPLSCESNSASDWAAYFGMDIKETDIFSQLPITDNPDKGFVGSVHGEWGQTPPHAYGVHAGPIASVLRSHKLNAMAVRNMTWETMQREIAAGRPVIAWVVGKIWTNVQPVTYTSSDGHSTTVVRYEHTVLIIGYDETQDEVTILDGSDTYTKSMDKFLASWKVLGNMAIIWGP